MKTCPRCQECKPGSEYHVDKRRSDGLAYYCKSCNLSISNEWKNRHPDRVKLLARVRMNRKGGHKAILERHATDNSFKVAFRNAIRAGKPLLEAIELLEIGPVRLAICKEIIQNDCMASTDHLLNAVYAVTPYSDDRSRAYRALIMAIHKLKWQLNNTGIAIISRGYRKGYSIVSVDLPRRPRKKHVDVI